MAVIFGVLFMWQGWFGVSSPSLNRSLFIFFAVLLVFIHKPLKGYWVILDYIGIIVLFAGTFYFNINYDRFMRSFGMSLKTMDIVMGFLMIILVIETARRQLGWILAGLSVLSLVYLVYGPHFPDMVAHAGFSLDTVVSNIYAGLNGMYGEITYVLANYMLLFLIFGAFLSLSGAGDFYLNIAKSLLGHTTGGGAKAAVLSSFVVGSVTGSAAGNVAITGVITIPLMKKTNYQAYVAGATEAAASTGGTILPPIMGAAAFIMSAITGRPYFEIVKIAAIPGIIYFCTIFLHVHLYASRVGLRGLPREDLPELKKTLKEGIQFIIPPFVLIATLVYGLSLNRVAMNSIIAVVLTSYIRKETRMSLKNIVDALIEAARTASPILAVAAPVSIIGAALVLPGTAIKLSGSLVALTHGNLLLLIIAIAIMGTIMGMGLDATAAYMVMASFGPPAMIRLGVPLLSAHLLILWYGQLSNITPPMAMASYVAASIAEANIWAVGMKAFSMALALLYLPLIWVYRPALILMGTPLEIFVNVLFVLFGVILLVAGLEGYLLKRMPIWLRTVSIAAAVAVLIPLTAFDYIGAVLGLLVIAYQVYLCFRTRSQNIAS